MFIFYFIGSVVKIACLYFLYIKDDRLELKRNMNDGTMAFLMPVRIAFFIKKDTLPQAFPYEFCEFSKNVFSTEFLRAAASDF